MCLTCSSSKKIWAIANVGFVLFCFSEVVLNTGNVVSGSDYGKIERVVLNTFLYFHSSLLGSEEIFLYIRYSKIVGELAANKCDGGI